MKRGDANAAYVWLGVFEADPSHPKIVAARQEFPWDAGHAALVPYCRQLQAAGIEARGGGGDRCMYSIQRGKRDVIAQSDQRHADGMRNPNLFTITIGPAGG